MSLCLLHCYAGVPTYASKFCCKSLSFPEPHCGAGFAKGCETSCLTLAMHRLSAESSQARHWLEIRTMVFWTLRLCVDVFPGPSGLIYILTLWNIFWNICTHSSRCFVSAVHTEFLRELFVFACCWHCSSLFTGSRVPSLPFPGCLSMGFRVPIPGCFAFFTAVWRVLHQPNPMISMPTSPSESLLLFTPWNQLNFGVTGFNTTRASRDNRSCHFHAQKESFITLSMY